MPFHVAADAGVLTLTLDTPGSPVNIFNHATARQLVDIVSSVTPATTRAIIFETAKINSFINGVGLLLAHASRTYDDILRASTPPWTAYRAVRDAPVPTIAVVQGNCFGCGVEFVLSCDYRIACDNHETQFYMTELNDYLFIPVFGSTRKLPEAVGLADAIDLLLWGERWDSRRACQGGLVDEVIPYDRRVEHRRRFVQRVVAESARLKRPRPHRVWSARDEETLAQARRRVAALPPMYQPVYADALALLESGMRDAHSDDEQQLHELRCSAASALSPLGKSAYAFFYLRQMASERAAGRARDAAPARRFRAAPGLDEDTRAFVNDLRSRLIPGVLFDDSENADVRLVGARVPPAPGCSGDADRVSADRPLDVAVRTTLAAGPRNDVEIYAPAYRSGGRLLELATSSGALSDRSAAVIARLARTLQRFGFEVARTTPVGAFVSTQLLVAYLIPLAQWVARGGSPAAVDATLREAGFVRRPRDIVADFDRDLLAGHLAARLGASAADIESLLETIEHRRESDATCNALLVDALCISLLEAALEARATGAVRDPSVTDLVARELLDFPRHLCSLGTWLKRARVAAALAAPEVRSLVSEPAFQTARSFVADGRELYR